MENKTFVKKGDPKRIFKVIEENAILGTVTGVFIKDSNNSKKKFLFNKDHIQFIAQ